MSEPKAELQRLSDGSLPFHAWPGGYTLVYLCADGEVICAKCANEWAGDREQWQGQEPIAADAHWEGPDLECANCNAGMPSEYGDPEEEL
jgi:hypothetical protein